MNDTQKPSGKFPVFWLDLNRVSSSGETVQMIADKNALEVLAGLAPVERFDSINADLHASRWSNKGILVQGSVQSGFSQMCVATLEPFDNSLKVDLRRTFVPESEGRRFSPVIDDGEIVLDPEDDDLPDIVSGGKVNLWDVVLEELNLEIDPYPRSPGAGDIVVAEGEQPENEATHRPFEGLEGLLTEKKPGNG